MSEIEEEICEVFGTIRVCVANSEDMGKKRIMVSLPNEKDKWFNKTEDANKYLKKKGASRNDRIDIIKFVSHNLRPARRIGSTVGGNVKVLGSGIGAQKEEAEEV
jgi:hypothetical protein